MAGGELTDRRAPIRRDPARVLIVEDDEASRTALARGLEHHGFAVLEAADGSSALQAYDPRAVDLIVLDVGLPDMDGFSVLTTLRQLYSLLLPAERHRAGWLFALMLAVALLETVGVVSIMPFMALVANPQAIETNALLAAAYHQLGFADPRSFLIFAGAATLAVAGVTARRTVGPVSPRPGAWAWALWCAAVAGWELFWLFGSPRTDHPTISSLVNALIATHPARAAAVLLWLAAGWWVVRP